MHVDRDPTRPTTDEVEWLMAEYYAHHTSGGNLHIVLDDANIGDSSVDFCIEYARKEGDLMGMVLGHAIRAMSPTQRGKLANCCFRRSWDYRESSYWYNRTQLPHGSDEWWASR